MVVALARTWTDISYTQMAELMHRRSHTALIRANDRGQALIGLSERNYVAREILFQQLLPRHTADAMLKMLLLRPQSTKIDPELAELAEKQKNAARWEMFEYLQIRHKYVDLFGFAGLKEPPETPRSADVKQLDSLARATSRMVGPITETPSPAADIFAYAATHGLLAPDRQIAEWLDVDEAVVVDSRQRAAIGIKHGLTVPTLDGHCPRISAVAVEVAHEARDDY